jgi:hypothetical protein
MLRQNSCVVPFGMTAIVRAFPAPPAASFDPLSRQAVRESASVSEATASRDLFNGALLRHRVDERAPVDGQRNVRVGRSSQQS